MQTLKENHVESRYVCNLYIIKTKISLVHLKSYLNTARGLKRHSKPKRMGFILFGYVDSIPTLDVRLYQACLQPSAYIMNK